MLSHLGQVTVQVADNMMVGQIGKVQLGGAAFANSIFVVFLVLGIGISYAITPQAAQASGERNNSLLTDILKHGLFVNIIFGAVLSALAFSAYKGMGWFDQPNDVVILAEPYLKVIALSLFPFMIYQAFRQFAEGLGYTKQSMYITIIGNLINIGLNYLFIFGKLGFPAMGLFGAGLATLISRVVMALLMGAFVFFNHRFSSYWRGFGARPISKKMIAQNLHLGIPMGFQLIFEVSTFSVAQIMIGWMGTAQLAAHQIAINMASITYMIALGIASAATIRVGNQYGKKDFKTMKNAAYTCYIMAVVFMSGAAIMFVAGRNFFPTLYIHDQEVISQAASLLIVAGLFQLSDGIQVIGLGALRGLSDVKIPTVITLIAYWLFGLPLGYVLGFQFDMGATGIWLGLLTGLSVAAVLLLMRFQNITKKIS